MKAKVTNMSSSKFYLPSFENIHRFDKNNPNVSLNAIKVAFEKIIKNNCLYQSAPQHRQPDGVMSKDKYIKEADEIAGEFYNIANPQGDGLTKDEYNAALLKVERVWPKYSPNMTDGSPEKSSDDSKARDVADFFWDNHIHSCK
jgi:hypothetical protein